eukprot:jgi/Ulvmu1/1165/UM107_0039.1
MGCLLHPESRGDCTEQKEAMTRCAAEKLPIYGLFGLAFILLLIATPVPLCMMCCCGERPVEIPVHLQAAYPVAQAPAVQQDDSQQPLISV